VVICLERGADLHTAQLMPLPLTVSCSSKIQIGFTFLVPADPGSPGQGPVKRVCVLWVKRSKNYVASPSVYRRDIVDRSITSPLRQFPIPIPPTHPPAFPPLSFHRAQSYFYARAPAANAPSIGVRSRTLAYF